MRVTLLEYHVDLRGENMLVQVEMSEVAAGAIWQVASKMTRCKAAGDYIIITGAAHLGVSIFHNVAIPLGKER